MTRAVQPSSIMPPSLTQMRQVHQALSPLDSVIRVRPANVFPCCLFDNRVYQILWSLGFGEMGHGSINKGVPHRVWQPLAECRSTRVSAAPKVRTVK
jgi:hypothetical protein